MSEPEQERTRPVPLIAGPLAFALVLGWPSAALDMPQRKALAVTVWTAIWWLTGAVPVAAASLLPAALFPLLGILTAGQVAPYYMSDLVFLFLGAFIVALGLERWQVHRRIALAILARSGDSPRRLVLGFMVAAAFLSLWINNTATTLMMLPIAVAVLERIEGKDARGGALSTCLLLGIAYSASVGGMGTPVGTAPNQVFLGQFHKAFPAAPEIGFGTWFLGWLPLVILWVPLAWWVMTRFVHKLPRTGSGGADVVAQERREQGPMTVAQKRMAIVFTTTAILWVTRSDVQLGSLTIPGWSRWFLPDGLTELSERMQHARDVSDATVATFMAIVCFVVPAGGGERGALMDWKTASRMPWDVLLLLGGGFALAKGFQTTGLDTALGGVLAPLYAGHSTWLVVLGTVLFMSLLTEFTSNTATTAVLLPVVGAAGVTAGLDPRLVMVPATIAASAAFLMPAATPPNAVVFATHRVSIPTMARTGVWLNGMTVILITVVFELWVRRIWGIGSGLPEWAKP